MNQKFDTDVVIVATAVRTRFWKEFYTNLTKNKSRFHLVFVGHTKPDFELPENFTYIYSNLKPAACVEIAHRYAHENINARFIMHTADDFIMYPNYLDSMIDGYDKLKEEYNDECIIICYTEEHKIKSDILVKNYENFIPLSYHYLNKVLLDEQFIESKKNLYMIE